MLDFETFTCTAQWFRLDSEKSKLRHALHLTRSKQQQYRTAGLSSREFGSARVSIRGKLEKHERMIVQSRHHRVMVGSNMAIAFLFTTKKGRWFARGASITSR